MNVNKNENEKSGLKDKVETNEKESKPKGEGGN